MNNQKYLFLKFENAGCFPKKVNGAGFIKPDDIKPNGEMRIDMVFDDALVNVDHISNVLHVLCGLHPVPSLYKTGLKRNEMIYNCACNAMIKFSNDYTPDKNGRYNSEFMQGKKCKKNSNRTIENKIEINGEIKVLSGVHNWKAWRRYLKNDELYNMIVSFLLDVCLIDDINKYTLIEAIEIRHKTNLTDEQKATLNVIFDRIDMVRKKPIKNILSGESFDGSSLNAFISNYPITNVSSVKKILRVNGCIMIPITDDILTAIKYNSGTATILDSGLIYVDDIIDSINYDLLTDNGWYKVKKGWQTNNNDK